MTMQKEQPELPKNWHWGIGNRSAGHYTYWLYTDRIEGGYEAQVWWDNGNGGNHHVAFYEILGVKDSGDVDVCEYPCYTSQHSSEDEAVNAAIEQARQLEP